MTFLLSNLPPKWINFYLGGVANEGLGVYIAPEVVEEGEGRNRPRGSGVYIAPECG